MNSSPHQRHVLNMVAWNQAIERAQASCVKVSDLMEYPCRLMY